MAEMSQIMNVMENSLTERMRNKRTSGDITMMRKTKHLVLGMLERGRMEQLLSLRTGGLLLSELERRKGRHDSG